MSAAGRGRRLMGERPLTLVACGASLAARAAEVAEALRAGWSVSVVVTEAASQWIPEQSEHDRPRPELVVACPLTFDTANKVAAGIMDSSAAGTLCDSLDAGAPVVAVPMVNNRLWGLPGLGVVSVDAGRCQGAVCPPAVRGVG